MSGHPAELVLHQFERSHFNEKARWGLAWKGLEHRRQCYMPGPHAGAIRKRSGQTATPLLQIGDEIVTGSAAILERLERDWPDPPLLSADPGERERALEIQREFDAEVGPAVRTALFSEMINESAFICAVFAGSQPALKRGVYRALIPITRGLMARAHDTNHPERVKRAFERSERALDFVARETAASGYLVGSRFGLADLCAAALLAPLTTLEHPDMAWPAPRPRALVDFHARWADHPGIGWVQRMYDLHRGGAGQA